MSFDVHIYQRLWMSIGLTPVLPVSCNGCRRFTHDTMKEKSCASAEESVSPVTTPPPAAAGGKGSAGAQSALAAAADGGDSSTMDQSDGIGLPGSSKRKTFYVEPETLELAIGETMEVRVWAFPTEVKLYKDTLIACLTDNPRPVLFPVSCSGAAPLMVLEGPWDKLLSAEQAGLEELGCLEVRGVESGTVRRFTPNQHRFGIPQGQDVSTSLDKSREEDQPTDCLDHRFNRTCLRMPPRQRARTLRLQYRPRRRAFSRLRRAARSSTSIDCCWAA